ncbi:hypothetical protein GA0070618_5513 [Micromonospora echinospora]|uniref:Uncharacterized protein n=1 Tax=Micromonospora echinospora TaxID=1877 RepID=A0A1C4ZNQ6_MICEC|nr:hypothetical protein GA0070618_5513 [Micromonospora echinospora]
MLLLSNETRSLNYEFVEPINSSFLLQFISKHFESFIKMPRYSK